MTAENNHLTCNFTPFFNFPGDVIWQTIERIGGSLEYDYSRCELKPETIAFLVNTDDDSSKRGGYSFENIYFNNAIIEIGGGIYCLTSHQGLFKYPNNFFDDEGYCVNEVYSRSFEVDHTSLLHIEGVDVFENFKEEGLTVVVKVEIIITLILEDSFLKHNRLKFSSAVKLSDISAKSNKKVKYNHTTLNDLKSLFGESKLRSIDITERDLSWKPGRLDELFRNGPFVISEILFRNGDGVFGLRLNRALKLTKTQFLYKLDLEEPLGELECIGYPYEPLLPEDVFEVFTSGKFKFCLFALLDRVQGEVSISCSFKHNADDGKMSDFNSTNTESMALSQWGVFGVILELPTDTQSGRLLLQA